MTSDDLSGRILSHYQILKHLGSGGMGDVYLAQDTQLERTVALKILPPEVASDPERMRRFVREAKAASAIDHPNIVHVYEINQAENVNFISMQYVEGQTLRNKIDGRPLSIDELLQTAIQISDALTEAHARGIIHRDIKPANIMISCKGQVKLLDFGLARIDKMTASSEDSQTETVSKTKSGIVVGTVAYMSPEQALGKGVDHRSDIFSTGIVLYEMATGQPPFSGQNPMETIDKIVHHQPESIVRRNYGVPQELERIIRKCMEKSAESRYQSSSEILVDLKNLKRDLDSSELKNVSSAGTKKEIRVLAVLPFKNINLDPKTEYLSDGITDSIINNVSLVRQIRVMARGTVFTYKNREVDPRQIGKELGVDGVVTGKLLQEGSSLMIMVDLVDARDGTQIWGEQYDRKLADILSLLTEISRDISNKLRIKLTEKDEDLVARQYTKDTEAYQLYLKGHFFLLRRSEDSIKNAIAFFHQAIEKDPSYALAYDGLSNCYAFMGISGAVLGGLPPGEVMPKAKEAAIKAIQLDDTLAQPHFSLAHVLWNYDWNWEATEKELNRAVELNSNYSATYWLKAFYLVTMGRKEEALSAMQRYRELDPGFYAGNLVSAGVLYYWAHEYDQAIEALQKVNEIAPDFHTLYYWLGATYLEKNDNRKALEAFQHSVTFSHRAPVALGGLGMAYVRAGQIKEAESILAEILEFSKTRYVPEFYLACFYGDLGKKDEAFELLDRAYQNRANGLSLIKVVPLVDSLRSDPRFSELLKRMKLD